MPMQGETLKLEGEVQTTINYKSIFLNLRAIKRVYVYILLIMT